MPWAGNNPVTFTLPQRDVPHGDPVLVHFFASWCEPCREELPALERLAFRGAPSLKIVAIAVADTDAPLRRLIETSGVTFPVLMDRDRAVARAWSISTLPSTVILDSRHRARLIADGDFAWDTLAPEQLAARLAAPPNPTLIQQSLVNQGGQ